MKTRFCFQFLACVPLPGSGFSHLSVYFILHLPNIHKFRVLMFDMISKPYMESNNLRHPSSKLSVLVSIGFRFAALQSP